MTGILDDALARVPTLVLLDASRATVEAFGMANQAHHRSPRYQRWAPIVTRTAKANPSAVCHLCGETLGNHRAHPSGKPVRWHAGHTKPGSDRWQPWLQVDRMPPPGDWLAPAASTCNIIDGNLTRQGRGTEPRSEYW